MTPVENGNAHNFGLSCGGTKAVALAHHKVLGSCRKPAPSKWDDAQKWLAGFSGRRDHTKHPLTKQRNSNADDRRLLASLSQRARGSCSSADGALQAETSRDCDIAEATEPTEDPPSLMVRSVCLRDTGTEMTPVASKEPSRTGTPLRSTTPMLKSPISSPPSTPGGDERRSGHRPGHRLPEINGSGQEKGSSHSLDLRAAAWDEAERAKYMARYKREEVKIQAWENHEKTKAEMEMRRIEVRTERMKSRAEEKHANKLAAARRIAEERRAKAQARLDERAARTSERADYIRKTGLLPTSFFSFKLPSLCGG